MMRVGESLPPHLPEQTPAMMTTATLVQMLISLGILAGLIAVGYLVVQRFRGGAANEGRPESDLLTKFQEMHHEGDISEQEYRTIKSVLGKDLRRSVKDGKTKL
jgi:uncharacterized membrane protein